MQNYPGRLNFTATFDPDADAYCTTCAYNLRGMTGKGCPECGTPFMLSATRRAESYGLYLAGLICAAGLAFSNIYIFYLIAELIGDFGAISYYGLTDILRYLVSLPMLPYLGLLLIFRRRIVGASFGEQLAWTLPAMFLAGFELMITLYEAIFYY